MLVWGKKINLIGIGEDMGNRNFTHCKWERTLVLSLQGKIWQYQIHKPYDSAIPFLDIDSRESLAHVTKEACKRRLVSAPFVKNGNPPSLMGEFKHKLIYL